MTKQELQRLREETQAIRQLKDRHEALKARRDEVQEDTYSQMNEEIHAEHERAVERVKSLRQAAQSERQKIVEEQQKVTGWLEQARQRESEVNTMGESGAMDASEAKAEVKRLSRKRSGYRKELKKLEKRKTELDAALAGRKLEKPSRNKGTGRPSSADKETPAANGAAPKAGGNSAESPHKGARKRKIVLVAVVALVAIVAVGGVIAVNMVNAQVETRVRENLEAFVSEQNMQDFFDYGEVQVNSARGQVVISDIEYAPSRSEDIELRADELSVSVSPLEAIALARNPETASVSGFDATGTGIRLEDPVGGSSFEFDELSVWVVGELSQERLSRPESMYFTSLRTSGSGARFNEPESGMHGELGAFEYTIEGRISPAMVDAEPENFLNDLDSVTVDVGDAVLRLGPDQERELAMTLGEGSWLANADNWQIEQFVMDMAFSTDEIAATSISLSSPLTILEGSWNLGMGADFEPSSIDISFDVEELHSDLRESFGMMFAMMGAQVPESGPFSFELAASNDGEPSVTIERR